MNLVIGNLISLIACILMVYLGLIKNKRRIIFLQTIQIFLMALSNLVLNGITGTIINSISCFRNILCYYDKLNLMWKILINFIAVSLSLYFNNIGLIGLLPAISMFLYTFFMDVKNIIKYKNLVILTMVLWLIYDIKINAYVSAVFDFLNIVANIISIISIKKVIKS